MKFYSFDEIRAAGDCVRFARDIYGAVISHDGRCAAIWRGGDNAEAVSIQRDKWYDHVAKAGGGILDLAAFKFGGDIQQAQAFLGEHYGLQPRAETGAQPAHDGRYDQLIREGYSEVARYGYHDLQGTLVHFVARLEHATRTKEFCQGTPRGWGLHGAETILYRLDVVAASPWVAVVEGEKSCDRMNAAGIPATTCCGGARKWRDALSEPLRGKHVAIFPDNDEPGREHALIVAQSLHGVAAGVRIIPPATSRPKGGIDDWMDEDGGHTADDVLSLIAAAPEWLPPSICGSGPTDAALREAKAANSIPFRNYIPKDAEVEKRGRKAKETVKEPRAHAAMLDDLSRRFLGFPRKVGDSWLFDHDRDSGRIMHIHNADTLLSWIGRRSKHNPEFCRGDSFVTTREFLASIGATAHRYESISDTPDFPRRSDVYYAHGDIPAPCPQHSRLQGFVDFFLPDSAEDRCLIIALACAPLWYIPGIDRPSWIIDSKDGQGSGKTNLAEIISELYGHAPISTSRQELTQRMDVLIKRLVSQSGRRSRVLLVDNVTGDFQSPELADLITRKDITGIPPYGHGEEVRQNNLTFIVTTNTATVGSDLADRSLYIHVRKPEQTLDRTNWKKRVQAYIAQHRLEIIADIIDLLSRHVPFSVPPRTRFAAWETAILQPCCGDEETYASVLDHITVSREESNVEQDTARAITDHFDAQISRAIRSDIPRPVFLRTEVVNSWGRQALNDSMGSEFKGRPIQLIRNLAKAGFLPKADRELKRWPATSNANRVSGIAWNFEETTEEATVIGKTADGSIMTEVM